MSHNAYHQEINFPIQSTAYLVKFPSASIHMQFVQHIYFLEKGALSSWSQDKLKTENWTLIL